MHYYTNYIKLAYKKLKATTQKSNNIATMFEQCFANL